MYLSTFSCGLLLCDWSAAAFCALKLAEKKFPSSTSLHIQLLGMQILHARALHRYKTDSTLHFVVAFCFHNLMCYYLCKIDLFRGHLKAAQQICDEFGVLSSSVSGVDIELKTEFSVRRARTLLAAKQFSQVVHCLAYIYTRSMHFILFVYHSLRKKLK